AFDSAIHMGARRETNGYCRGCEIRANQSIGDIERKRDAFGHTRRTSRSAPSIHRHEYFVARGDSKGDRGFARVRLRRKTWLNDQWERPLATIESRGAPPWKCAR